MRASWNWLCEFVDLGGLDPNEVAERMTMAGLEVDAVETIGGELDGVVVGKVLERAQHPGADKLSVCRVDVGADQPLRIVCGAQNYAEGDKIPVAQVGTKLPGDFKIKKSKIRGEESFGMMCSGRELGISEDHEGLLILDADAELGQPIADALGLRDTVFEIGLTPNRSDCLGIYGIARDLSALLGRDMLRGIEGEDERPTARGSGTAATEQVSVVIDDGEACPRYACAIVRGVKVAPSPDWMQQRLIAIGQRPVNNLVDVTNYALFENGQPLHAFDLERLAGDAITVRRARDGETIESIDHVERELRTDDIVICDADGPVAIAGVMGGVRSEIDDDTTDVLIECANFHPSPVRKTSRRLGMHTESSHRFERGVDFDGVPACLERAVELLLLTQQGIAAPEVANGTVDVVARTIEPNVIEMPLSMPGRILGIELSATRGHHITGGSRSSSRGQRLERHNHGTSTPTRPRARH